MDNIDIIYINKDNIDDYKDNLDNIEEQLNDNLEKCFSVATLASSIINIIKNGEDIILFIAHDRDSDVYAGLGTLTQRPLYIDSNHNNENEISLKITNKSVDAYLIDNLCRIRNEDDIYKGLGKILLDDIENYCKNVLKIQDIYMTPENKKISRYYSKFGYKFDTKYYDVEINAREDIILYKVMTKKLY